MLQSSAWSVEKIYGLRREYSTAKPRKQYPKLVTASHCVEFFSCLMSHSVEQPMPYCLSKIRRLVIQGGAHHA